MAQVVVAPDYFRHAIIGIIRRHTSDFRFNFVSHRQMVIGQGVVREEN